nr:putative ORF1 [Marmot picobirnavirus]
MTRNQIAFQEHKENVRNHRRMEQLRKQELDENARANIAKETENTRSNKAREKENSRANQAQEAEAYRSHTVSESMQSLDNMRKDVRENRNLDILANHYAAADTGIGMLNISKAEQASAAAKQAVSQAEYYKTQSGYYTDKNVREANESVATIGKLESERAKNVVTTLKDSFSLGNRLIPAIGSILQGGK